MFGLDSTGFTKKTFNDIMQSREDDLKSAEKFGPNFDFRDGTPQRNIVATVALELSDLWDLAEDVYHSAYVELANDISLDYAIKYGGITRFQANKSSGQVTFTGTDGTIVPISFVVKTENGIEFKTTASGTITAGTVILAVEALIGGSAGDVAADSITLSSEPLAGLASLTNVLETDFGADRETNFELKIRFSETLAKGGGSTPDSIRATLLQILDVEDALVRENETDAPVGGVPANSIAPVVLGGLEETIQDQLRLVKAGGNQCFGTITKGYTDDSGNSVTIGFVRPTDKDIWLQVNVGQGTGFPVGGLTTIQTLLVDYINALKIGDDVIHFDLLIEVGKTVPGITSLTILTSDDDITYLAQDITVGDLEKAKTEAAKVVVT